MMLRAAMCSFTDTIRWGTGLFQIAVRLFSGDGIMANHRRCRRFKPYPEKIETYAGSDSFRFPAIQIFSITIEFREFKIHILIPSEVPGTPHVEYENRQ